MPSHIYVNKSGASQRVNDYNGNQLGTILANETFCIKDRDPRNSLQYAYIYFRKSDGSLSYGYMFDDVSGLDSGWELYPIATNDFYDYSTGGVYRRHMIYNVRRSTPIYGPDGVTVHHTVPAGGQVAVSDAWAGDSGSSHPDWLEVNYWRDSASGSWVAMYNQTGGATAHGFAPIGLNNGSMETSLSVYGNW